MTSKEHAWRLQTAIAESGNESPLAVIAIIEDSIKLAIEETHRDWAHALMTAVEEHFPLLGREWREWPASPDVGGVCDWLKRLVEEIRADEREACREIALTVQQQAAELLKVAPASTDKAYYRGRGLGASLIAARILGRS